MVCTTAITTELRCSLCFISVSSITIGPQHINAQFNQAADHAPKLLYEHQNDLYLLNQKVKPQLHPDLLVHRAALLLILSLLPM